MTPFEWPHSPSGSTAVDMLRQAQGVDDALLSVPCYRIDGILAEMGVHTVGYLSVDVEGAKLQVLQGIDFSTVCVNVIGVEASPGFADVYRLLIDAGFEYQGLLFFDEIFVHREACYTWEQ